MPVLSSSQLRDRVRATRYRPQSNLVVGAKTIGTEMSFSLSTKNLSRTGMLLGWEQSRPIPFIENTIVEMTIDAQGTFLKRPLSCLGKIVRRSGQISKSGPSNLSFGISIIQIDHTDVDVWEDCLRSLADAGAAIESKEPILQIPGKIAS